MDNSMTWGEFKEYVDNEVSDDTPIEYLDLHGPRKDDFRTGQLEVSIDEYGLAVS